MECGENRGLRESTSERGGDAESVGWSKRSERKNRSGLAQNRSVTDCEGVLKAVVPVAIIVVIGLHFWVSFNFTFGNEQ